MSGMSGFGLPNLPPWLMNLVAGHLGQGTPMTAPQAPGAPVAGAPSGGSPTAVAGGSPTAPNPSLNTGFANTAPTPPQGAQPHGMFGYGAPQPAPMSDPGSQYALQAMGPAAAPMLQAQQSRVQLQGQQGGQGQAAQGAQMTPQQLAMFLRAHQASQSGGLAGFAQSQNPQPPTGMMGQSPLGQFRS